MTIRLLLIGFLLATSSLMYSQDLPPDNEALFVDIYMTAKQKINDGSREVDSLLQVHQISREDYKKILTSRLHGEQQKLTKNQSQFAADLIIVKQKLAQEKQEYLETLCNEKDLSLAEYSVMLEKYRSDIHYQHRLKKYFDQYINSHK